MTEEQALLAGVNAVPEDDLPRLVYADWLEEHDQGARAEFIRRQCEMARNQEPRRLLEVPLYFGFGRPGGYDHARGRCSVLGDGVEVGDRLDLALGVRAAQGRYKPRWEGVRVTGVTYVWHDPESARPTRTDIEFVVDEGSGPWAGAADRDRAQALFKASGGTWLPDLPGWKSFHVPESGAFDSNGWIADKGRLMDLPGVISAVFRRGFVDEIRLGVRDLWDVERYLFWREADCWACDGKLRLAVGGDACRGCGGSGRLVPRTRCPDCDGLKRGDRVIPGAGEYLRCGSAGLYLSAVVVSANPFTLVSEAGDMLWVTVPPTAVTLDGRSSGAAGAYSPAFERWERSRAEYQTGRTGDVCPTCAGLGGSDRAITHAAQPITTVQLNRAPFNYMGPGHPNGYQWKWGVITDHNETARTFRTTRLPGVTVHLPQDA
jgi:uncharacterized protein (TIGR02996 family)